MIKIYHNPRCSKSREGLALLEEQSCQLQTIKYLDTPISETELRGIIQLLGIKPIELVRTNESVWKELFKDKQLDDNQVINAMLAHPNLIERPIVINGNKAVIGRPSNKILEIL
jgi:arsenate reductase